MGPVRWVFGYGSLVWRPAFEYATSMPVWLHGWRRRFFQGSPDHRGTEQAPGRVVTLEPAQGERCLGVAYAVQAQQWSAVVKRLDHREQGGYERHEVQLVPHDASRNPVSGIVYMASPENRHYLGPAPLREIAAQIVDSHGPSGSNVEYLLRLEEALSRIGGHHLATPASESVDPHVTALAVRVRRLLSSRHSG